MVLRPQTEARPPSTPTISDRGIGVQKSEGEPEISIPSGNDSRILFAAGRLAAAAEQWKREFKKSPAAYSIFLELDCREESVLDAYGRIPRKGDFFILPRKYSGKTCYLVLWGKFATQNEAASAMKEIPPFFFQQHDPPQVVALATYL